MTMRSSTHRMLLACVSILLLLPVSRADVLPRGDAKAAGFAPEKLEGIAGALKEAVDKKKIAGGSALVARQRQGRLLRDRRHAGRRRESADCRNRPSSASPP